jgi:hypothetical protein
MKVFAFFCTVFFCFSCGSEYQHEFTEEQIKEQVGKYNSRPLILEQGNIVITEVIDIPPFEDVTLELMRENVKIRQGSNKLEFTIQKFILGEKTVAETEKGLVKENSGQYLMVVSEGEDKNYSNHVKKDFVKGDNQLLAFLCRSYGVSLKSADAHLFYNINVNNLDGKITKNTKSTFLYLNAPERGKKFRVSDPILLDFFLVNFAIQKQGNFLKLKIDNNEFELYKWCAFTVSGLEVGEHKISLQAYNKEGKPMSGELLKRENATIEILEGIAFE